MSEQQNSVVDEAVRLVDALRRRMMSGGSSGDVWAEATSDAWGEHVATGAPECRYCPVCRAIALSRGSGPEVVDHLMRAGESLYAAFREAMAGMDRTGPRHQGPADGHVDAG